MSRRRIIDMVIQLLPILTKPLSLVDEMIKMVHATSCSVLMQVNHFFMSAFCIILNCLKNVTGIAHVTRMLPMNVHSTRTKNKAIFEILYVTEVNIYNQLSVLQHHSPAFTVIDQSSVSLAFIDKYILDVANICYGT